MDHKEAQMALTSPSVCLPLCKSGGVVTGGLMKREIMNKPFEVGESPKNIQIKPLTWGVRQPWRWGVATDT